MQDMKSAGLNPILAASGGFNVGSSPNIASAQAFKADQPNVSASNSALNLSTMQKTKEESKNIRQDTLLKIKQTAVETEKILKTRKETGKLGREEALIAQEVINAEQRLFKMAYEMSRIEAEIAEINQRKDLEHAEMEVQNQKIEEIKAMKGKILAEARTLLAKLPELEKRSDMYKGVVGRINAAIKETFSMLHIVPVINPRR